MLKITPESALIDSVVCIEGKDLTPGTRLTITATTHDLLGHLWRSEGIFVTDTKGNLNIQNCSPIKGTYTQEDPMGLLWSMLPQSPQITRTMFVPPQQDAMTVKFSISTQGKLIAEKTIERKFISPGVMTQDIDNERVVGRLFIPEGPKPYPAILLCGGNEGGVFSQAPLASLLASYGYVVLVVAYCNYPNLPKFLYEIPLERFRDALVWLKALPEVDAERVAVIASSKGAEGVLASASYLPDFKAKAMIAISPSNVVWQGIGQGKPEEKSSWSLHAKPLPYIHLNGKRVIGQFLLANLVRRFKLSKFFPALTRITLLPLYQTVKANNPEVSRATLPVEKIQCPLLLIAGNRDKIWPSVYMSQSIMNQRKSTPFTEQDKFVTYDQAGHIFLMPNLPTSISWRATPGAKMILNYGGDPKENAFARRDGWESILSFLRQHLSL